MGIGPWRRRGGRRRSWINTTIRPPKPAKPPAPPKPKAQAKSILLIGGSLDSSTNLLSMTQQRQLIQMFSAQEWSAVWCGMSSGLAGKLTSEILLLGCKATAVLVKKNEPPNIPHLAQKTYVKNFHERGEKLFSMSDAALVVPGGLGTVQELTQLIAWRSAGLYDKPIVVFDPNDYFKSIRITYQKIKDNNSGMDYRKLVLFIKSLDELPKHFGNTIQALKKHHIEKWHLFVNLEDRNINKAQKLLHQISACTSLIHLQNSYRRRCSENNLEELSRGDWWTSHTIQPQCLSETFTDTQLIENMLLLAISQSTGRESKKWDSIKTTWNSLAEQYALSLPSLPHPKNVHSKLETIALFRFALLLLSSSTRFIGYNTSTQQKVVDILLQLTTAAGIGHKGMMVLKAILFDDKLREYLRPSLLEQMLAWMVKHPQKKIQPLEMSPKPKLLEYIEAMEKDIQMGLDLFKTNWESNNEMREDKNNVFLYYALLSVPNRETANQVLLFSSPTLSTISPKQLRSKIQLWQPTNAEILSARKLIHLPIDWTGNDIAEDLLEHFHPNKPHKFEDTDSLYGIYAAIYAFHPNQKWNQKALKILQDMKDIPQKSLFLTENSSKRSFIVWATWLQQHTSDKAIQWFLITLSLISLEHHQIETDVDKKVLHKSNFFWAVEALTNGKVYDPPSKFALLLAMGI